MAAWVRQVGRWTLFRLVFALACASSMITCDADTPPKPNTLAEDCATDADCADNEFCTKIESVWHQDLTSGYCTKPCKVDTDCANGSHPFVPLFCGVLSDLSRGCVFRCGASGIACVDGVPTACAAVNDTYCFECGCPASLTCQWGVGCIERQPVGSACSEDDNCVSGNCSPTAKICRVAAGCPCTASNCDMCFTYPGTTWTFCSRACTYSNDDCGKGGVCLTSEKNPRCYAPCSGCPTTCAYTNSGDAAVPTAIFYCDI